MRLNMERGVEVDRSRFFNAEARKDSLAFSAMTAAISVTIRIAGKSVFIENPAWVDFMATVAAVGGLTLVMEGIIEPAIRQIAGRLRKSAKGSPNA